MLIRDLLRPIYHFLFRGQLRLAIFFAELRDRILRDPTQEPALPPASLRYLVSESISIRTFEEVGSASAKNLQSLLAKYGRPLSTFEKVLDFGCGCGRTLRWFAAEPLSVKFYGTDTNMAAIEWCRRHLKFATFVVNERLPPLPFPESTFDLVYSISVFTHLDEPDFLAWIEEIKRVLRPGGLLVLTLHGRGTHRALQTQEVEFLQAHGFLFKRSSKLTGILPEWYHTAFHAEHFARASVGKYLAVREYIPEGFGFHDVLIAER